MFEGVEDVLVVERGVSLKLVRWRFVVGWTAPSESTSGEKHGRFKLAREFDGSSEFTMLPNWIEFAWLKIFCVFCSPTNVLWILLLITWLDWAENLVLRATSSLTGITTSPSWKTKLQLSCRWTWSWLSGTLVPQSQDTILWSQVFRWPRRCSVGRSCWQKQHLLFVDMFETKRNCNNGRNNFVRKNKSRRFVPSNLNQTISFGDAVAASDYFGNFYFFKMNYIIALN